MQIQTHTGCQATLVQELAKDFPSLNRSSVNFPILPRVFLALYCLHGYCHSLLLPLWIPSLPTIVWPVWEFFLDQSRALPCLGWGSASVEGGTSPDAAAWPLLASLPSFERLLKVQPEIPLEELQQGRFKSHGHLWPVTTCLLLFLLHLCKYSGQVHWT